MTSRFNPLSRRVELLGDTDIQAALAEKPILVLPVGAVESHGDHLPAGTDNILAGRLAEELVRTVGDATPLLLLPVLPFGQVWSLGDAPGSFGISGETLAAAILEIAMSAKDKGLETLAVVNAHLGNSTAVRSAQRKAKEAGFTIANFFYPGSGTAIAEVREKPEAHPSFMHACEIETSYMLHLAPGHVAMDKAIANYPEFPEDFGSLAYRWSEFSQSPVLGDATAATAGKGKRILDAVLAEMARQIAVLYARQS